jgi:hypothetical protein
VNHFRASDPTIGSLIKKSLAGTHPFVVGELAVGNLKNRAETLDDFALLPQLPLTDAEEAHDLLESRRLWGKGLGWIDLHLLAATKLAGWSLYTADTEMAHAARQMGIECV